MARLVGGLRPDDNPLRRSADRAEALLACVLVVGFILGAPVSVIATWHWAYANGKRVERIERADRHRATAVLLQTVPKPSYTPYGAIVPPVLATWKGPGGVPMTGVVNTETGRAGTRLTVYINASGHLVSAPPSTARVAREAALGAASAPIIFGAVLLIAWMLGRVALNRRRMAAWDAEWEAIGPLWTSRR